MICEFCYAAWFPGSSGRRGEAGGRPTFGADGRPGPAAGGREGDVGRGPAGGGRSLPGRVRPSGGPIRNGGKEEASDNCQQRALSPDVRPDTSIIRQYVLKATSV